MADKSHLKYQRILENIGNIALCTEQKLILVGGTALTIFYLKHRISQDLDFVPLEKEDVVRAKERLKGVFSKMGYTTLRAAYTNQFILQLEDTSIKIEIFDSEVKVKKINALPAGENKILIASLEDLLEMKIHTYKERKEARDLFDIVGILKKKESDMKLAISLVKEYGIPDNIEELRTMILDEECGHIFEEVLKNAAKTSG